MPDILENINNAVKNQINTRLKGFFDPPGYELAKDKKDCSKLILEANNILSEFYPEIIALNKKIRHFQEILNQLAIKIEKIN